MSMKDPYSAYKRNDIEGASQGRLVVMLYDGAIRFLKQACASIEENDISASHENIMRAENILAELMNTLNLDAGEVAHNLLRLYEFMIWHLIQANKDKDRRKIEDVIGMLLELRSAWNQIVSGNPPANDRQEPEGSAQQQATPKKLNLSL